MGCAGSKDSGAKDPRDADPQAGIAVGTEMVTPQIAAELASDVPATQAISSELKDEARVKRLSISYQSKEIELRKSARRRSSAMFDRTKVGTHTKHGVMPGPWGNDSKAKINQDRGVICWPFAGSYNEALFCVFDGHGTRGEKVSELCMKMVPKMLDEEHSALIADPTACLSATIIALDHMVLHTNETTKRWARSCGTTSNVLYMRGHDLWVACSGDSRAIKASRVGGRVVASDLSNDHKPDLPVERRRIEAAGGVVSKATPNGGPSRVWANGAVGLAMSRSIGDGECKSYGVIPDPEVLHFTLSPAKSGGEGDLFIIVASDGVWEFIESQEAAEVVAKHPGSATEASEQLVKLASERWWQREGNYRDDITAIVTFLPFLEADDDEGAPPADSAPAAAPSLEAAEQGDEGGNTTNRFINKGAPGISRLAAEESSSSPDQRPDRAAPADGDGDAETMIRRRLSVVNPYLNPYAGEDDDDDDAWEKADDD